MHPAEHLDRDALAAWQGTRLSRMLSDLYGRNAFYTDKLDRAGIRLDTLALPGGLDAVAADDEGGAGGRSGGAILPGAPRSPSRWPATRATARPRRRTGRPLRWIDTNESWQWTLDCWKTVYRAARVGTRRSRVLPVLLRAVPRLLGRLRGGVPDGPARGARRRDVEPHAPGRDRRGRGDRRLLHADLCAPPGRGGLGGSRPAPAGRERRCAC